MKNLIQRINKIQKKQLYTLKEMRAHLKTKQRGLYWIWTNLDFETLKSTRKDKLETIEKPKQREVPISKLVNQRAKLTSISTVQKNGFRIVYNGVGGYLTKTKGFGLRERINQEFKCNDHRTGTLNITRGFDLDNWRVSFFNFDDKENIKQFDFLKEKDNYLKYAKDLETIWRLEYGFPILCRH